MLFDLTKGLSLLCLRDVGSNSMALVLYALSLTIPALLFIGVTYVCRDIYTEKGSPTWLFKVCSHYHCCSPRL